MVFESVCFSLRYCGVTYLYSFGKSAKNTTVMKTCADATSAIERLELSNSSLLAASLVSIR